MIDSDRLAAFVVFGETRNLTRAAEALHISQPSLHAKLKKLAVEVGVPLYVRDGRRLVLTSAGAELLRHGLEQRDRDERFLAGLGGGPETPIVLAAGVGALRYLLGAGIAEYLAAPPAPLRLWSRDADEAAAAVWSGEAHLGVGVFRDIPSDLESSPLARVGSVLVVPENHPLRGSASLDDLDGASLIVPPPGSAQRRHLEGLLRDRVTFTAAVEARGWELALHLARMGLGLAVVNEFCPAPEGCRVVALPELGAVEYSILHRPDPAASVRRLNACLVQGAWRVTVQPPKKSSDPGDLRRWDRHEDPGVIS